MGYNYTTDDFKGSLRAIQENLQEAENMIDEAVNEAELFIGTGCDYYRGEETPESLKSSIEEVIYMFDEVDEKLFEFQSEWNRKIEMLKKNAEDRFKYLYENAIIEVKK